MPVSWEYFAIDDVPYRGHLISIVWDKSGKRLQVRSGFHLLVDGKVIKSVPNPQHLLIPDALQLGKADDVSDDNDTTLTNFAVNNDGTYYRAWLPPLRRGIAHFQNCMMETIGTCCIPPNRWTSEGSGNQEDWIEVDFGMPRLSS